jgi:4-amino-4-deoxy-L-arabinose transferase-like glycosyltransferase
MGGGAERRIEHGLLLLTTWAYLVYTRKPQLLRYGLVLVLYALGLMSKPMLVTLPCTLLLLDVWPWRPGSDRRSPRACWLRLLYEKIRSLRSPRHQA